MIKTLTNFICFGLFLFTSISCKHRKQVFNNNIQPVIEQATKQEESTEDPRSNVLFLDGGGVRALVTLGILQAIQRRVDDLYKEKKASKQYHLGDLFEGVGGTSTGVILLVMMGIQKKTGERYSIDEIAQLYIQHSQEAFERTHTCSTCFIDCLLGCVKPLIVNPCHPCCGCTTEKYHQAQLVLRSLLVQRYTNSGFTRLLKEWVGEDKTMEDLPYDATLVPLQQITPSQQQRKDSSKATKENYNPIRNNITDKVCLEGPQTQTMDRDRDTITLDEKGVMQDEQTGVLVIARKKNTSNTSHYNFYLHELMLAGTSAPSYFVPIELSDTSNELQVTVYEGGNYSNNPINLIDVLAYQLSKPAEELEIVSLGTGKLDDYRYSLPYLGGLGVFVQQGIMKLFIRPGNEVGHMNTKVRFKHTGNYHRLQPIIPNQYAHMDDFTNAQELYELGQKWAEDHPEEIKELATKLIENIEKKNHLV